MERNKLGMLLFISSEAFFFAALIITYFVHRSGLGSQAKALFDVPITALFSVALFSSSGTMELAHRRSARGDRRGLRAWLLVTMLLGIIFLGGQLFEYRKLFLENVNLTTGIYGSSFFTLTGFHGLHVLVGLILMMVLWSIAGSRDFFHRGIGAVEPISWYWHFVDAVWVAVFSLVYLLSLL